MKKLFLIAVISALGFSATAQTFKVGASVGIPLADASDISSFVLGADAYYYFSKIDAPIELGVTAGFRNFFGKDYDLGGETYSADDAQFLPIAAAARLKIFGILSGGADIGYAVGISDFLDGGFYFRPVAGIDIADAIEVFVSYEGIADAATWGNLNAGILFEF